MIRRPPRSTLFPTRRSSDLNDEQQALRVADHIDAGMVFVNGVGLDAAELPFGGVKGSGFGRELGRFGADELDRKSTRLNSSHANISYAVFCLKKKILDRDVC